MKKTKIKNQKPIELDVHLKYLCSNNKCGYCHWLSLSETKTKNFKVVCECGQIFKPKLINTIKILYNKTRTPVVNRETIVKTTTVPLDLYRKCATILTGYGFSESETLNLVTDAYITNNTSDAKVLIKYILQNLEE